MKGPRRELISLVLLCMAGVLSAAVLIGCSAEESQPEQEAKTEEPVEVQTEEPESDPTQEPSATPDVTETEVLMAAIIIENPTTVELCEFNLTQDDSSGWGENRLTQAIPAGGKYESGAVLPGIYHFRVVTCAGDIFMWSYNYDLPPDATLTLTASVPEHALVVQNNTLLQICGVSILRLSETGEFGMSLIDADEPIGPETLRAFVSLPGSVDVHIQACSGEELKQVVQVNGATPFTVNP